MPAWDVWVTPYDPPIEFTISCCLLRSLSSLREHATDRLKIKRILCVLVAWDSPELACGVCCIHLSKPAAGDGSVRIPALPVSATFAPFLKSWRNERKASLRTRYYLRCFSGLPAPIPRFHPNTGPVQINAKVTENPVPHSSSTLTLGCSWLCNCTEWLTQVLYHRNNSLSPHPLQMC